MEEKSAKKQEIVRSLYSGELAEKYRGKHVVITGGEVHPIPYNDEEADRLFEDLEKKYPQETPTLLFVPKEESYIL